MAYDMCVYNVRNTSSSRTHKSTIDIKVDSVRAFLSDNQAEELVKQILNSLATEFEPLPKKPSAAKLQKLYQQLGIQEKLQTL